MLESRQCAYPRQSRTWTASRLGFIIGPIVVACSGISALGNGYHILMATNLVTTLLLTLSLDVVVGNLGLLSLAHGAFFATGAYTGAVLTTKVGLDPWLCLPLAVFATMLLALVLGVPVVRLRGLFLAVATLAFASFLDLFIQQATPVTNGAYGISGLPRPIVFGVAIVGPTMLALQCVALSALLILLVNLRDSPLGRSMLASRDSETAAAASGIVIGRTRLVGFIFSAGVAGLAGWFHAFTNLLVTPDIARLEQLFIWLFMVLIGGAGSLVGVVAGTILLVLGPEVLGLLAGQQVFLSGVVMLLVIVVAPKGIGGLLNSLWTARFSR